LIANAFLFFPKSVSFMPVCRVDAAAIPRKLQ
jgi:hypothetical protein